MRNSANQTEKGSMTLDQVFKSLGDPHRLQIMHLLQEKEMSAGEILEEVDVVQSTLSHHMKSLVDSGVVRALRRGKWTYYSINTETVSEAENLLHAYSLGTKTMVSDKEGDPAPEKKTAASGTPSAAEGNNSGNAGKTAEDASDPHIVGAGEKEALNAGRGSKKKQESDPVKGGKKTEDRKARKGKKGKKNKK